MIVSFIFNTHVDLYFVVGKKRDSHKIPIGYNVFATAFCVAVLGGCYLLLLTASDNSVVKVEFA